MSLRDSRGRFVSAEVKGLEATKKALQNTEKAMAAAWVLGLKLGAMLIKADSVRRTPVEFGLLRKSCGHKVDGQGWATVVSIFYTAEYAVYVHEILTNKHPVGEAKFLENAVNKNTEKVLELIKQTMAQHGYSTT